MPLSHFVLLICEDEIASFSSLSLSHFTMSIDMCVFVASNNFSLRQWQVVLRYCRCKKKPFIHECRMNWRKFEERFVLYFFNKIIVRPDGKIVKLCLWTTSRNSRPYRDRDSLPPMSVLAKGPTQPHVWCVLRAVFRWVASIWNWPDTCNRCWC